MKVTLGNTEYFKGIGQILFEGKDSDNPLAFKYYDRSRKVGKKTMEEHLRFAIAYWHTFGGTGGDPFGAPTKNFPWLQSTDPVCTRQNGRRLRIHNEDRCTILLFP
jgi:xylose isomerase